MAGVFAWFRANLSSLLLSLLVGLTIWVIVNQEQNPMQEQDLPNVEITVTGLGDGLLVTNTPPTTARLLLRAQQTTWSLLTEDRFTVTADLTGLEAGSYDVPLEVTIPPRVSLRATTPESIRVVIEDKKSRELPIQVHLEGELGVGFRADQPSITPPRVTATGPRSAVDLISEVRASVRVQDARDTIKGTQPLVALDASGNAIKNVTLNPAQADVTLPLVLEEGYKDVAIYPRTEGRPATGYYVTGFRVVPDRIIVRGDPQIINAMLSYVETQQVNLTGLTTDMVEEVTLDLPPGVTPVEDQKIQMFVAVEALQGSRKLTPQVQVVGLGEGLTATVSPTVVDVILSGPLPILDLLNQDEDVIVTVDLTGLTVGTYNKEPSIQITRSEISSESVFPGVISVTITQGRR